MSKNETQRERNAEKLLKSLVEQAGGVALKITSPGAAGVPDRLVIFPGRVIFVELKSPTGSASLLQKWWGERLTELGQEAIILRGADEVKAWALRGFK